MNTAVARRLALGDRVVWIGGDGYRPSGAGTISRITVHEVEVRWDGGTVTRYRRAHLHNLRHVRTLLTLKRERESPRLRNNRLGSER